MRKRCRSSAGKCRWKPRITACTSNEIVYLLLFEKIELKRKKNLKRRDENNKLSRDTLKKKGIKNLNTKCFDRLPQRIFSFFFQIVTPKISLLRNFIKTIRICLRVVNKINWKV